MPRQPASISPEQAATLNRAFALLQAGRPEEALSLAQGVSAAAPKTADSHHLVALSRSALGDRAGAEKAFRQALKLSPEHPQILSNYANWLNREKRTDDALAAYRRSVKAAPDFVEGWINMAIACLEADKAREAVAALERALKLAPQSSTAWQAMGNAKRKTGDLKGAEAAFRTSLDLAPGNGAAWINLGVVLRLAGRPAEALPCYDKAEKTGFTGPALMDARSGALLDTGDIVGAYKETCALTERFPDHIPGHHTLSQLLWEHGATLAPGADSCDRFRQAVDRSPENDALRTALAAFLIEARRYDEALEHLRLLRRRGDDLKYLVLEANALEMANRPDEAGPLYAQAHKALGENPAFLNAYARHLLKAGDWAAAARRAEKATRLAPNDQEAWAYLATAWRLLGDPREEWLCDYERTIAMTTIEPPPPFAGEEDFCLALREALEPMHLAKREPVNQSLRGGSQTAGRLFGRPDPLIAAAHDAFVRAVEKHIATLPDDPRHPFFARKARSVAIGGSWSVKLWSSGSHVNHIHPEGWMSSAFYVCLPPSVSAAGDADRSGWIQFGQPPLELELGLPPRRALRPEIGSVALFPSYMWHGTAPFEDESPRMTIAFDMTPAD